ncbi:MAG: carbohydrate ABC transporter permease [Spirochaetaceae bacterium]|jgi:putative aldouronate transport system permease protein|nr:carbohydrate ABC transporter permease [Spirochaetaceae bacterium]
MNTLKKHGKRVFSADKFVFHLIGYVLLAGFAFVCLAPFYLVAVNSFMDEGTIIREGFSFYPRVFSLTGYSMLLKNPQTIINSYGITVLVTVLGTVLALLMVTMTGFVLSRTDFHFRNFMSFFFYFTTLFNGGLVPYYLLCTRTLHFTNKVYALILPMLFSVWNMIIAKNFFKSIPFALVESAKIDGANDLTIYFKLILPISMPLLATIGLFTALGYWNDWYNCMLFINNMHSELWTLQYYLQNMLNSAQALQRVAEHSGVAFKTVPLESMKLAMTVVATGPMLLAYPFVQKYFVKGLTIGAVKG